MRRIDFTTDSDKCSDSMVKFCDHDQSLLFYRFHLQVPISGSFSQLFSVNMWGGQGEGALALGWPWVLGILKKRSSSAVFSNACQCQCFVGPGLGDNWEGIIAWEL
jgi:hypothetical protein